MNHIMLDLETLDTSPSAVIVSVGMCEFDETQIGEKIHFLLDLKQQEMLGRTLSASTVQWWVEQEKAAQAAVTSKSRMELFNALNHITDFIQKDGRKAMIWGNGADFDNIILGSLYDAAKLQKPWSYSRNRCFRTVKNLYSDVGREAFTGTAHNALDDAINQTQHLQRILGYKNFKLG